MANFALSFMVFSFIAFIHRPVFLPRVELFVWPASILVVCAPDTTLFCRTSQFTKRNDCDEA
jgi:hypothetical protein